MKILKDSREIQRTIRRIKPSKIAVAYIGIDYKTYVDTGIIEDIIISPTISSNPQAIGKLVEEITWDKTHFLRKLHSKLYVGDKGAVICSANLSKNGLGVKGLKEIGVLIEGKKEIQILEEIFNKYLNEAKKEFETTKRKETELQKLHDKWKRLPKGIGFFGSTKMGKINFNKYSRKKYGDFKLTWYNETYFKENRKQYERTFGRSYKEIYKARYDQLPIRDVEEVQEKDLVLIFKLDKYNRFRKNGRIDWIRVDAIVENGARGVNYPHVIVEFWDEHRKMLFNEKDPVFKHAFSKIIKNDCYEDLRMSDNIIQPGRILNKFLEEVKAEYRKLKRKKSNGR